MGIKLFDSEIKVMEVLWKEGNMYARDVVKIMNSTIGWNRNTTYTILNKLVKKGILERKDPNFFCSVIVTREEIQKQESDTFLNKFFDGSPEAFLSTYFKGKKLSKDEAQKLKDIVDELE